MLKNAKFKAYYLFRGLDTILKGHLEQVNEF